MSHHTNAVCIGCRLRRKKCNREKPICSSCLELNISPDLCIYPKTKLQLASKDSKITLDLLRSKNKELKSQLEDLKNTSHVAKHHESSTHKQSTTKNLLPTTKDKGNTLLITTKETNEYLIHCGPLSWTSLMNSERELALLCDQFNDIIAIAKLRQDQSRGANIPSNTDSSTLNDIKGRINSILMGLEPTENTEIIMGELFLEIERILPPYDLVLTLIDRFFLMSRIQKTGILELNEEEIYEILDQIILKDINGRVKITVKFPDEYNKAPGLALILAIVANMLFQVNQLLNPITSANHILIVDCIKVLFIAFSIFKRSAPDPNRVVPPASALQLLQSFMFYVAFDRYNPHGNEHERSDKTGENYICVSKMITYARALKLNKNIDEVYKSKSKSYRRSLKSVWYMLAFHDVTEAIEFGFKTKIHRDELFNYDDYSCQFTRSIKMLYELVAEFQSIEHIEDPLRFIQIIEESLIYKAKKTLTELYSPFHEDVRNLNEMNFDDISLVQKFSATTQTFNIRITLFALIQTFYYHCYKRLQLSGYQGDLLTRYHILSMKYSLLVFNLVTSIFASYRRLWSHENSTTFGSLTSVLAIFPTMKLLFRRVTVFIGSRVFENLAVNKSSAVLEMFEANSKSDTEIIDSLLEEERPVFFTIEDLEDLNIDDNNEQLFEKFGSRLLDYKFALLTCCVSSRNLVDSLRNTRYNLDFVKMNRAFFFALKLTNFFARLFYDNDRVNPNSKDRLSIVNNKNPLSRSEERSLRDLIHKKATSESFDFETFFNTSN